MKLLQEDDGASTTATIEFDSKEDVLTAQTKDMKTFDGNAIEVQVGTGSTLFVTNFPPTADEAYIRDIFSKVSNTCPYGIILSMLIHYKVRGNRRYTLSFIKV